jgi:hypothetical protein
VIRSFLAAVAAVVAVFLAVLVIIIGLACGRPTDISADEIRSVNSGEVIATDYGTKLVLNQTNGEAIYASLYPFVHLRMCSRAKHVCP